MTRTNGPRKRGGAGRRRQAPPAAPAAGTKEPVVFPEDAEGVAPGRLTLPSSGLASDILALAATAPLAPLPAAAAPAAAAPAPEPAAAPVRSHNISFFGSQSREEKKAVEATEHLATFFLAGEEYGVDVRLVQEIIRLAEITQVPRAPQFVKGVINLRGRIIPVIDLKRKLGLGAVEPSREARIVVVRVRERLMGLLVDGASQVLKVPVSLIEAAPDEVVEIDASYIRGVAKLETRLIILVDLPKVLSAELRDGAGAESA
ncbi:MAG TPA: chemotaxis protein CheW [Vicinamibacteria bacterium]